MNQNDYDEFTAMINGVADLKGRTMSEWALSLWWISMKLYDFAAVKDALGRHLANPDNGQYMPMPADITKLIGGTTIDAAQRAWSMVDRAVRVIGPHRDVVFDDALIHRVLADMGGWVLIGAKSDRDWPFVAKEFETRYRGYVLGERPDYPPILVGIANSQNSTETSWREPPMLIGDPHAAAAVMDGGSEMQLVSMVRAGDRLMSATLAAPALRLGAA